MSSKETESLWREFFRDPSQFWDNRNDKRSSKCPDFRHKQTRKVLWIDRRHNPSWVRTKLRSHKFILNDPPKLHFEDRFSLVSLIKSFGKEKNICKVRGIGAKILEEDLITKDIHVATCLLNAYAKCGALIEAQEIFEQILAPDVVSWNALIAGYVQNGLANEALQCFKDMKDEGVSPNVVTYTCILKACGISRVLDVGADIDTIVREQGLLKKDLLLGSSLISMYANCGAMEKAREVFGELPVRDVVAWTALVDGYVQHQFFDEALNCFQEMKHEGILPNTVTYICILKACAALGSLHLGEEIDAKVRQKGLLNKGTVLGNALVNMYVKCGALEKANELFESLLVTDVVSWTSLIAGYVHHEMFEEAMTCFRQMQEKGVSPNLVTYICILKACGIGGYLELGKQIDTKVRKQGYILDKDSMLGNALIDMYMKCGALKTAQEVFEQLEVRDVVTWNTLMTGYVQFELGDEAFRCFRQMQYEGISPNTVTYVCTCKACGIIGSLEIGEDIHAEISNLGLLQKDIVLATALVDMYIKCGIVDKAQKVFEHLLIRDVVSWTTLIAGYVQHGLGNGALDCFRKMQGEGIFPTGVTYALILRACGIVGSLEIGEEIAVEVTKQGFLKKDVVVGTALVEMYILCGALEKAQQVFDELPVRDVVAWTSLMDGYAHQGLVDEVLNSLQKMQDEAVPPNPLTYACVLETCGIGGCLAIGKHVDIKLRRQGLLQNDTMLGTALVGMYAKCGALEKAREVFEQLGVRDVLAWNTLLAGYAQLGQTKAILNMVRKMRTEGILPDLVTFLVLLVACNHSGFLAEGEILFDEMWVVYCLPPTLEHYACMIDLFGRAGNFKKTGNLLEKVSSHQLSLFLVILGSCHKWADVNLGKWAFEQSIQLDEKCSAAYVCMENIYARMETRAHAQVLV